jgi:polyferredoxin
MAKPVFNIDPTKTIRWRPWVQLSFVLLWLGPVGLRLFNVCGPVFHCYGCPLASFACPIGVMAQFSQLHFFPFIAVGTLLLTGALLGGFVCGWICPFGFVQDLLGRLPTRKFQLPAWVGYFRYVVLLGAVVAVPFLLGEKNPLFICNFCPAGATEASFPAMIRAAQAGQVVTWPNVLKLTVLGLVVAALFVKWRPWCSTLCPLGAIFGFCNRFAAIHMKVDEPNCHGCGRCEAQCRYGVTPHQNIDNALCIRCQECTRCSGISIRTILSPRPLEPPDEDET